MQTSAALLLHAECCCVERHAWLQRTGRGRAIEYDISPVEAQAHLCCVSMGLEETAPTGARTCPSLACSVEHMQSTSWAMATLTNLIQSEGVAVFQCLHQHGGSKLLHSATLPRPQVYLSFQDIWLQPVCRDFAPNGLYNFETWGQQLADFIDQIIGEPAFLLCNSVGGEPARCCCMRHDSRSHRKEASALDMVVSGGSTIL